jgi:hypothetical protein
MPIYIGKEMTATLAGRRIVPVTCQKCATSFHYELTRLGIGKGSAPYFLGQKAATNHATAGAERELGNRLEREAELVPCPKCHWVNQELIDRYRGRQYRGAKLLIVIIMVGGLIAGPCLAAALTEKFGYQSRTPAVMALVLWLVCFLSPIWVLLIRRQLRHRIDPNVTYPRRPTVPPGTPPALVEERDPRSGLVQLYPVPSQPDGAAANSEWATFRPGQMQLPWVCCRCLAAAATVYRSPLQVDHNSEVEVPLCKMCSNELTGRWWRVVLMMTAGSLLFGGLLAVTVPSIDSIGRWFVFGIISMFGALVGGVVAAARVCRPYRLRVVDADRGIVRFSAKNPAYTGLLANQVRASEGLR